MSGGLDNGVLDALLATLEDRDTDAAFVIDELLQCELEELSKACYRLAMMVQDESHRRGRRRAMKAGRKNGRR